MLSTRLDHSFLSQVRPLHKRMLNEVMFSHFRTYESHVYILLSRIQTFERFVATHERRLLPMLSERQSVREVVCVRDTRLERQSVRVVEWEDREAGH